MPAHTEIITRSVSFCDVDFTGVMWHGNYAKYFEEARCRLLEKIGLSYETILSRGYGIPVISMKVKYRRPCHYNQKINIEASLEESEHLLIVRHEIRDFQTNEKMSEAETRHMAFCLKKKKGLLKLPNFMSERIFAKPKV
jgi:acyl-CoA thioester hydrolase